MKRLDAHIRSLDSTLEQAPKVFKSIRVDVAFGVALRVIYHIVNVFVRELVVRAQLISVNLRSLFNVFANGSVKVMPAGSFYNLATHARAFVGRVSFQQSHDGSFAHTSSTEMHTFRFMDVACLCSDESFVRFDMAFHLHNRTTFLHGQ